MDKLEQVIESIVFLSGTAVDIKDIASKLNLEIKDVEQASKKLQAKYNGESGIHLLIFNKKLQFSTNPAYSEEVETVLNPIKEKELSKSMMEVCAIVAYKQPVTRLEIEEVRGVNSDYAVVTLSKHNIIDVVGRKDAIGKPLLYGTTDEFLKRFQLSSINDLPDYDELLERIKVLYEDDGNKDLYYREQYNPDNDLDLTTETEVSSENELVSALNNQKAVSEKESKTIRFKKKSPELEESEAKLVEADEEIIKADTSRIISLQQSLTEQVSEEALLEAASTIVSVDDNKPKDIEEIPEFLKDEKDIEIIN